MLSDRKKSELHMLKEVVQDLAEGVCLVSANDSKIVYANRKFNEMFGYHRGMLIGQSLDVLMFEEDASAAYVFNEEIKKTVEEKGEANLDVKIISQDKTPLRCRVKMSLLKYEECGKVIICIFADMVEEKQVIPDIIRQRNFFQSILNSMHDLVVLKDRQSIILQVNAAVSRFFGMTGGELVGKSDFDLFPAHIAQKNREEDKQVFETGKPRIYEKQFKGKKGKFWFHVSKVPVLDPSGKVYAILCSCRNINERKKMEERLRISEEKFRAVFENTAVGIALISPSHDILSDEDSITECNKAMQHFFGYSEEELKAKTMAELIHPLNRDLHAIFFEELLSGKRDSFRCESRFIKKDGHVVWGNHMVSLIKDARGRPIQIVNVLEDITEQKNAQDELQTEKERYRLLYEDAPICYQILDSDGRLLEVNDHWLKTLGYERGMVIGQLFCQFLNYDQIQGVKTFFPQIFSAGVMARGVEFEMIKKDGSLITVYFTCKVSLYPDGSFRQIYCVFNDITEQKRMQNLLVESEERFRCLADATFEGVCIHDRGTILEANALFAEMFGYRMEELVGRSFLDLVGATSSHDVMAAISSNHEKTNQIVGCRKDGTHFPLEVHGKAIPFKERIVRVIALRDITAVKKAEEVFQRINQELEKRVQERTATLVSLNRRMEEEILEREKTEKNLKLSEAKLKAKKAKLEDVNTALRVLLKESSAAKEEFEKKILTNIKKIVEPNIYELENTLSTEHQRLCLDIVRHNIQQLTSSFARKLLSQYVEMTPREIQIADLVRQGRTNKDIARLLNVSQSAVDFHRRNLRKKFKINGKNINLRSYLLSSVG